MTWEQAVEWLRNEPGMEEIVKACYFEPSLLGSAKRFAASEEFEETHSLIKNEKLKIKNLESGKQKSPLSFGDGQGVRLQKLLDIGSGRGIAAYAFAQAGFEVTALEPDPSNDVGAGAIRQIARESGVNIEVVENWGESLPFDDNSFEVVYARQVLHHAHDLPKFMHECARVLKPGGIFLSTRDHVISGPEQMQPFLKNHGLHHLYGGENAFTLTQYEQAIIGAGLSITQRLGSYDSVINYAPMTREQFRQAVENKMASLMSRPLARMLARQPWFMRWAASQKSNSDQLPGRLVSFVAVK